MAVLHPYPPGGVLAFARLCRRWLEGFWSQASLQGKWEMGNGKWYAFALLFHPISHILLLLISLGIGLTIIPDLSSAKFALIGQAILVAVIPNLFKNIFEEFAWRGYLAPKIQSVVTRPLIGHALVGMVWFGWHLPYYLVLLDPAIMRSYTSLSLSVFLPMTLLGFIAVSIVYGEIRIRTNSVWPAVLMHVAGNVFLAALVEQKFFSTPSGIGELLVSPGWSSLISIVIFAVTGIGLYRLRRKSLRAEI